MLVDFHARESVTSIGESISNEKISRVSVLLGGSFDPYNLVGTLKTVTCNSSNMELLLNIMVTAQLYIRGQAMCHVKILHQQQNNEDRIIVGT